MRRLFLCLSLFLWAGRGWSLTVSQLKTEIRIAVQDNSSDTARFKYSDVVLLNLLNEGQREINNTVWPIQKSTEYVLTAFTSYYALPSDLIAVFQVYFRDKGSNVTQLTEYSQKTLYDSFTNWEYSKGGATPSYYWVSNATNPTNVSQSTWPLQISYIPIPNVASTGTARIWYFAEPDPLNLDSDIPFDSKRDLAQYHYALVYYAASRLDILEGDFDSAKAYHDLYMNAVAIMKDRLGRMPGYTPSMIGGSPH